MSEKMLSYKRCRDDVIVTLEILGDTNEDRSGVVDANYAMFRTNRAKVVAIESMEFPCKRLRSAISLHTQTFTYTIDTIVKVNVVGDCNKECGPGIYYYKTKDAACNHCAPRFKYTGEIVLRYDSGAKFKSFHMVNGNIHGKVIVWYKCGAVNHITYYVHGSLSGISTMYYQSGLKQSEITYVNDLFHGKETVWYESGRKRHEITFKHDVPNGPATYYYNNGRKSSEGVYKDDCKVGTWTYWDETGASHTKQH